LKFSKHPDLNSNLYHDINYVEKLRYSSFLSINTDVGDDNDIIDSNYIIDNNIDKKQRNLSNKDMVWRSAGKVRGTGTGERVDVTEIRKQGIELGV
jgi:hypothetical protein